MAGYASILGKINGSFPFMVNILNGVEALRLKGSDKQAIAQGLLINGLQAAAQIGGTIVELSPLTQEIGIGIELGVAIMNAFGLFGKTAPVVTAPVVVPIVPVTTPPSPVAVVVP